LILRVILPTTEIIQAHRRSNWLLGFYDEGIKGLVRDTVLHQSHHNAPFFCEAGGEVTLLEDVVRQYENSMEYRFIENTLNHCYPTSQVEMVVTSVADDVAQMMRDFFAGHAYDVCKSRWQWLEDDLIVTMHFQDAPCKRAPSTYSSAPTIPCRIGILAPSWFGSALSIPTSSF